MVESLRPDTESFPQLEPGEDEGGDEETTVSAEYEAGYGQPAGARPISAVPDPGDGSDDDGELSAGDEMDFAAPLDDDEPDLDDAPADQGSPPQREPDRRLPSYPPASGRSGLRAERSRL